MTPSSSSSSSLQFLHLIYDSIYHISEIDLLSAFEVDENIVGIDPLNGRYRAYQFYMYSKEIKSSQYIGYEILENMLTWSEFIIVANVRLDKNGQGTVFAIETPKGRPKFVLFMDSPAQKVGIRSHLQRSGKKTLTFKKVPFKQQQWHRVVLHMRVLNETKPVVDLYVDCKFVERKNFPISIREALNEDKARVEFRLGQIKNHGKDIMKFVVGLYSDFFVFYIVCSFFRVILKANKRELNFNAICFFLRQKFLTEAI